MRVAQPEHVLAELRSALRHSRLKSRVQARVSTAVAPRWSRHVIGAEFDVGVVGGPPRACGRGHVALVWRAVLAPVANARALTTADYVGDEKDADSARAHGAAHVRLGRDAYAPAHEREHDPAADDEVVLSANGERADHVAAAAHRPLPVTEVSDVKPAQVLGEEPE